MENPENAQGKPEPKKIGISLNALLLGVFLILVASIAYTAIDFNSQGKVVEQKMVAGVPVYSQIPIADLSDWGRLALVNSTGDDAQTTCNFEIAAVSTADRMGPVIKMQAGPMGIQISRDGATLQGDSQREILKSCHAFVCLLSDLDCPDNIEDIEGRLWTSPALVMVASSELGGDDARSYAELLGLYGFLQSARMDANANGIIEESEKQVRMVPINSYLQNETGCYLQAFTNFNQNTSSSDTPVDCNTLGGIWIVASDDNRLQIEDNRIILNGRGDSLFAQAVIVRDAISPRYIRAIYGLQ